MLATVLTIDEIKKRITPIAQHYGVDTVYLFGSYARGEATSDSDLDFYIEKGALTTLFQLGGFICDLEDEFGCKIDLLSGEIEDKDFYDSMIREVIPIYENKKRYNYG